MAKHALLCQIFGIFIVLLEADNSSHFLLELFAISEARRNFSRIELVRVVDGVCEVGELSFLNEVVIAQSSTKNEMTWEAYYDFHLNDQTCFCKKV